MDWNPKKKNLPFADIQRTNVPKLKNIRASQKPMKIPSVTNKLFCKIKKKKERE